MHYHSTHTDLFSFRIQFDVFVVGTHLSPKEKKYISFIFAIILLPVRGLRITPHNI